MALQREDYEEQTRRIGHGAFATVYICRERKTHAHVAAKVVRLDKCKDKIETFQKEVALLRQCHNPYIVQYLGSFVYESQLWILMELVVAGSAFNVMRKLGPFPEGPCALIMHDTLEGLVYLHGQGQAHMDVKPANILLTLDGHCKLCDLGVAKGLTAAQKADPDAVAKDSYSTKMAGTLLYMSPEMVLHQPVGVNTDIWSLGISAIEIATGRLPRAELHQMKAIWMTAHSLPPTLEGKFSSKFKDFVTVCLEKDPAQRVQAAALLKHKFVKGVKKCGKLVDIVKQSLRLVKKNDSSDEEDSDDEPVEKHSWDSYDDDWLFD